MGDNMKYIIDGFYKYSYRDREKLFRVASEALIDKAHTCSARICMDDGRKPGFLGIRNTPGKNLEYVFSDEKEERKKIFKEFLYGCFDDPSICHLNNFILADSNGRELIMMHDDCFNSLFDLGDEEYVKVSEAFEKNGLPKDALYPEQNTIRFRRSMFLGGHSFKAFSPKEYEALAAEKKKGVEENWEKIDR